MHGCRLPDMVLLPQTNTDMGFLMSPGDGAVSAVRFFAPAAAAAPTHLLSGAADGSISIWASGDDWDCLKTLPGHKCAPLQAHPTRSARPQPTGPRVWKALVHGTSTSLCPGAGGWAGARRPARKEVSGLAVHASGRLALSTGRDGVLRMWNLVKGRCQYKTGLAAAAEAVEFRPGGGAYALACGAKVRGALQPGCR